MFGDQLGHGHVLAKDQGGLASSIGSGQQFVEGIEFA